MIEWDDGFPTVPFSLLLLQKLQGWDDHRKSDDDFKRLRQSTDAEDVLGLLSLSGVVTLSFSKPWSDRRVFSFEFELLTRERVREFCTAFPQSANEWRLLGFET